MHRPLYKLPASDAIWRSCILLLGTSRWVFLHRAQSELSATCAYICGYCTRYVHGGDTVQRWEGACRYITNTEWISGSYDGSVALWSQLKKKPVSLHRGVHATGAADGPGSPSEEAAGWVQSVAVCPQSDLVVRTPLPPPAHSLNPL